MLRRVKRIDQEPAPAAPPQLTLGLPTANLAMATPAPPQPASWRDVAERLNRRLAAAESSPTAQPTVAASHTPHASRITLGAASAPASSPRKD